MNGLAKLTQVLRCLLRQICGVSVRGVTALREHMETHAGDVSKLNCEQNWDLIDT